MKSQTMLSKFIKLRERESPNQERLEDAEPSRGKTGPNETNWRGSQRNRRRGPAQWSKASTWTQSGKSLNRTSSKQAKSPRTATQTTREMTAATRKKAKANTTPHDGSSEKTKRHFPASRSLEKESSPDMGSGVYGLSLSISRTKPWSVDHLQLSSFSKGLEYAMSLDMISGSCFSERLCVLGVGVRGRGGGRVWERKRQRERERVFWFVNMAATDKDFNYNFVLCQLMFIYVAQPKSLLKLFCSKQRPDHTEPCDVASVTFFIKKNYV